MAPSFFSRKRGHQPAPSVCPPQTQTLDIAAISLVPSSAGAHRSYLGACRPDESMVSPPTSPDACTTIPPSQPGLAQAPSDFAHEPSLLPGIEKLGVRSPSGSPIHKPRVPSTASLQSGSYHGALQGSSVPGLPTHAQHYHHRGSSSSSLSSYDSYMLDELDEPIEHSSAATTASSRSARSSRQRDWLKDVPEASTPRILSPATYSHQEPQLPTQSVPLSDHQPRASPNNPEALSDSPALSYPARRTSSRYNLADFHFVRTLGTGSFGRVHLVRSRHNNQHYAIKVLHKASVVQMKQVEHTNSERDMLERVRHPFLINLWGTFKDCRNLYMVMDFVPGGELFSLLRRSRRFPDPVAKFFAAEVALALDYLHSLDIIYRDLKPENILLAADGHIKITDFGFAKYVPDITWTLCGTPDYLAPEIVQSRGYNKSVDWYAMGVLIFEMLAGYPPFFSEDPNPMRLYERIIAGGVRYPSLLTLAAKDLLQNLLTPDLTQRYGNLAGGSQDIFAHSWFAEVDWEHLYKKETPAPYVPRVLGDGDASCFETYKEIDISTYGQPAEDPHGHLFDSF